jgi:hypothetical protein
MKEREARLLTECAAIGRAGPFQSSARATKDPLESAYPSHNTMFNYPIHGQRAALLVAHPGHELRVHHWIETARPVTFALTKGDGAHRVSRLESSTKVLERAGASIGSIYGRLDDREVYRALLARDHELFTEWLAELVTELIALDVDYLVADGEEGYNPSHDVCHYLASASTAAVARTTGRTVADFDFPLIGPPDACPADRRLEAVWLHLDDDALARKLQSAREYTELREEVERAVQANGAEAFRVECLRPVKRDDRQTFSRPFYEQYGEQQVAKGIYSEVIRYDQHIVPLKNALWYHAAAILA